MKSLPLYSPLLLIMEAFILLFQRHRRQGSQVPIWGRKELDDMEFIVISKFWLRNEIQSHTFSNDRFCQYWECAPCHKNAKWRHCWLFDILDKRFAEINLVHLKRSRGPSPPQAARRKASAVSPFAQRLILKLNFTFQRSGRGMLGVFENMIWYYGSPIKNIFQR